MKLEIERLAFDSLRNLGEVAEPVKQKSLCDYAESKRESNKYEAGAAGSSREGPSEFSLGSKSSGKSLICRVQNELEIGKVYELEGRCGCLGGM